MTKELLDENVHEDHMGSALKVYMNHKGVVVSIQTYKYRVTSPILYIRQLSQINLCTCISPSLQLTPNPSTFST